LFSSLGAPHLANGVNAVVQPGACVVYLRMSYMGEFLLWIHDLLVIDNKGWGRETISATRVDG